MANKVYYGEYSLQHWIDLILSKNIVLPKYQRSFVWDEESVIHLIESIQQEHFVPPVTLGVYTKDSEKLNLILDGQQRLTSILLAYLGRFPNKEYFNTQADIENINVSYHDTELNEELENENTNKEVIKWTFSELLKLGSTKSSINKKITSEEYKQIDYDVDDNFFSNNYLGFSFLIPEQTIQKNYFASIFIDINTRGEKLSAIEIREALYYLDENLKDFFDPTYTVKYIIKSKSKPYKMDFVKYLAIISQYINNGSSSKNIAIGTQGNQKKLEIEYFLPYIENVINDKKTEIWGEYTKISNFFPNNSWKIKIDKVGFYLEKMLGENYTFTSVIDVDMFLFGLVYFVLFENKTLSENVLNELSSELKEKSKEFKDDKSGHGKSPNQLKHIKMRVDDSIRIYQGFIDESA